MSRCLSVLFVIFHSVNVKIYGRNNNNWRWLQNCSLLLSNTFLKWSHLHSNRFLWTSKRYSRTGNKFYCFSNCLLVNLKNILELEQWTNRNQEFRQWTNRKQRGPQKNSVDISPIHVTVFIPYVFIQTKWEMAMTTSHHRSIGPVLLATAVKLGIGQERGTRDKPSQ